MYQDLKLNIEENIAHGNTRLAIKRVLDSVISMPYHPAIAKPSRALAELLFSDGDLNAAEGLMNELFKQMDGVVTETVMHDNLVNADQISKEYGGSGPFRLQPASFSLKAGSLTGIVGQNGHGKTTLLRMLAAELSSSSGRISYAGIENDDDFYAIRNHVGYIPQRIPKWHGSLSDTLMFVLSSRGIAEAEITFKVEIMLKRLGLYKFRDHSWKTISSGYRTRFELARILLTRPKVLILDEPLANLDIKAQQTFLQDLRYIAKSETHPMAVILSSQQLHEVEQVADHVFFIKDGQVIMDSAETSIASGLSVIEFISDAGFDAVRQASEGLSANLKSENNLYTLEIPAPGKPDQALAHLLNQGIDIQYYRDITHSTKRLF